MTISSHNPKTWNPFSVDEMFAANEFDANKMVKHDIYGETVITYNDLFKYPHRVKDYFLNAPAPLWAASWGEWKDFPGGKNDIEYWDCRHNHVLHQTLDVYKVIDKIIYFNYSYSPISADDPFTHTNIRSVMTNMFQWKNRPPLTNIPDCFGNQPHPDGMDVKYAVTIGLNDEEDIIENGIGFYESIHGTYKLTPETERLILVPDNMENGRSYYNERPEKFWKMPPKILKHDFNKLIIYKGEMFHGAYHNKLDFMNYPRITMASFL